MNKEQMLKIYEAVAGPIAENNVNKALRLIKNKGMIPRNVYKSEIRTWYRVKAKLKKQGFI